MTEWIENSDTESEEDDTTDSEEEWHHVKGHDVDSNHLGAVRIYN